MAPTLGFSWPGVYASGPSFFSSMTKFSSLARARVIGPEGGAWGGGASGNAREGAAGVDVLVVSSSHWTCPVALPVFSVDSGNCSLTLFRVIEH